LVSNSAEIQIGKYIAQHNQAAVLIFSQDLQGVAGATHICAEMQIRKDQRVEALGRHNLIVVKTVTG
jgi:hypothetical protein